MMANFVKIGLWVFLGVLHLPTLALPWLYWRRRQYDPLRSRRPALFTQCLTVCVAFIWHQVLRNALGLYVGAWFDLVVGSVLLLAIFETFFVFALSLYVAFNKTKEQMAMYTALAASSTSTPADVDAFMRSIRWSSFLLSDRFAFGWVWANVALWMALILAYARPTDPFYGVPLDAVDSRQVRTPFPLFTLLILGRNLITIACLVATAVRLRIVQDAFGTKAMLARIGMFTTCTTTFYLLANDALARASPLGIQYMINVVAADFVIVKAFLIPLLRSRHAERMMTVAEGSTVVAADQRPQTDFELFLRTADGFAAFKAHLEKEFSVENLLFWGEVMKFRTDPSTDHAWAIHDKFLSASAPLEVNLPSASLRKFREQIFKDRHALDLQTEMFDDSADQLVRLMEVNSLQRFLKTAPPSWSKFMEVREEQKAMEHAGALRKTVTATPLPANSEVEISIAD